MYNHFLTLLVNRAPDPRAAGAAPAAAGLYPGDEAVPVDFRPVKLPPSVVAFRAALFGADPDRVMLAYRGRQLLCVVHATELSDHVFALDPRVTYDPTSGDARLAASTLFTPAVTQTAGVPCPLGVVGSPTAPDARGQCLYSAAVTVDSGLITVTADGKDAVYLAQGSGQTDGPLPLGTTGYGVYVPPVTAASWVVSGALRPAADLGRLLATLDGLGAAAWQPLFGGDGAPEPYLTFWNLWNRHPEFAYRLGAAVCAMVYRAEDARVASNA